MEILGVLNCEEVVPQVPQVKILSHSDVWLVQLNSVRECIVSRTRAPLLENTLGSIFETIFDYRFGFTFDSSIKA